MFSLLAPYARAGDYPPAATKPTERLLPCAKPQVPLGITVAGTTIIVAGVFACAIRQGPSSLPGVWDQVRRGQGCA